MNIARLFITRPVLAFVINVVVVMLGLVTWWQLPVRQYPQVETPIISVRTQMEGASSEIIEAQITRPLEEALAGIAGLNIMTSASRNEESVVKLLFQSTRSLDAAASDVRDALSRVNLAHEATVPRITKADADAETILNVVLYSPNNAFSLVELTDYANRFIAPALQSVAGVATVDIDNTSYEMVLSIDPQKLSSQGLTLSDVSHALQRQNLKRPAGRIMEGEKEYSLMFTASLHNVQDFNRMILGYKDGQIVRLQDVGKATLKAGDERIKTWYNGHNAVMSGIIAQSGANPISISQGISKHLEEIENSLPSGMKIAIAYDRSIFIKRSIDEVYRSIAEAVVLVVLVILVFLRSWRAALIPVVTIPISLIGTFFVLYSLGFSINTLTLLAMVLAIGLVVDDAIVVLENIYRYVEEGMPPFKAALKGTQEIQFSVIGMTLTLAAVYTPIALSSGVVGKLFTEFALTLAGSVLISGFVALTLSPMMCSRLLKHHTPSFSLLRWADRMIEGPLQWLERAYNKALGFVLMYRKAMVTGCVVIGAAGYATLQYRLKSEMAPREDQGLIKILAESPAGATMDYLERHGRDLTEKARKFPEIRDQMTVLQAGGESFSYNILQPWEKRQARCEDILPHLVKELDDISALDVRAYCPSRSLVGTASERPVELVIQTNQSYEALKRVVARVMRMMRQHPGINAQTVRWNVAAENKDYAVSIDRDRAAKLGLRPEDAMSDALNFLTPGAKVTRFERLNKLYPVRIKVDTEKFKDYEDMLGAIYLRGSYESPHQQRSTMVPLSSLVQIEPRYSMPEINRFAGMRAITINAALNPGHGLGEVYAEIKDGLHKVLPSGYRFSVSGELRRFLEERNTTYLIFGLALVFVFLIMAAQFESLRDPFIIMFTVPLALSGAIFTLWVLPGGTINIYSQIGLVTLIGLITKHGILMVDFANQLRQHQGMDIPAAIRESSKLRLRPILMTTFAMVLGAVPLALASGAGSEARRQLGWTIVGGMSLGTLFTLFVIPVMYTFFTKRQLHTDEAQEA